MAKRTWESFVFLCGAFTLFPSSTVSSAEKPTGPASRVVFDGSGMRNGVGGSPPVQSTIQSQGLTNPALKLTQTQMAQIDRIVATYVVEEKTLRQRYGTAQASPLQAEAALAARQSRAKLTVALGQVLNGSQRKIWEAYLADRGLKSNGSPASITLGTSKSPPAR